MFCFLLALTLAAPAWAQDAPVSDDVNLASLQAKLTAAQAAGEAKAAEVAALEQLLGLASIFLDSTADMPARRAAAEAMAEAADPRGFVFIRAASHDQDPRVRRMAIDVAPKWNSDEAARLLGEIIPREFGVVVVTNPWLGALSYDHPDANAFEDRRKAAIKGLGQITAVAAADALWRLSGDGTLEQGTRVLCKAELERSHPGYLAKRGVREVGSDMWGSVAGAGANGLAGGVMLSAVGTWGQSEAGATIGGLGGTAIGLGTAALYIQKHSVSRGQGLRYASNVIWGHAGALQMSNVLFGNGDQGRENEKALLRVVGVGLGAWSGFGRFPHDPDPRSVMEVNGAGLLGAMLVPATMRMWQPERWDLCEPSEGGDFGVQQACYRLEREREETYRRYRSAGALAGSALGLGLGTMVADTWQPDGEDFTFASVMAVESMVAVGSLPEALELHRDDGDSFVNLGMTAGFTGGLALAHYVPMSRTDSGVIATGAALGNLFGAGVAMLPPTPTFPVARGFIPGGVLGAAAAGWSTQYLDPNWGDVAMIGVGTALVGVQAGSIGYVLQEEGVLPERTAIGLTQMTIAGAGAGFLAYSGSVDPKPIKSLYLLSTAGWGLWFGSLGQVALDTDLMGTDLVLVTTGSLDVGLGIGALLSSDLVGIAPEDTMVPQLFGVGGGTLGALGVMLGSENPQAIATGALAGSAVGLGLGAVLGPKISGGKKKTASVSSMHGLKKGIDLPGHWSFIALPAPSEDGIGGSFMLSAAGL